MTNNKLAYYVEEAYVIRIFDLQSQTIESTIQAADVTSFAVWQKQLHYVTKEMPGNTKLNCWDGQNNYVISPSLEGNEIIDIAPIADKHVAISCHNGSQYSVNICNVSQAYKTENIIQILDSTCGTPLPFSSIKPLTSNLLVSGHYFSGEISRNSSASCLQIWDWRNPSSPMLRHANFRHNISDYTPLDDYQIAIAFHDTKTIIWDCCTNTFSNMTFSAKYLAKLPNNWFAAACLDLKQDEETGTLVIYTVSPLKKVPHIAYKEGDIMELFGIYCLTDGSVIVTCNKANKYRIVKLVFPTFHFNPRKRKIDLISSSLTYDGNYQS